MASFNSPSLLPLQQRLVLSISQINQQAKKLLEQQFAQIWVTGEISNLKKDAAGHVWFSLKEKDALLPCVLFRRDVTALQNILRNGSQVMAMGRLTIYPQTGRYQMVASTLELCGAGALQAAFIALKEKLQTMGLFEANRKKALPKLPQTVAVLTSPTGAVLRDIVQIARRRFHNAHIILVPSRVQGAESVGDILEALQQIVYLAQKKLCQVAIIARGGGSLEDLWAFNDEKVALAIANMPIPIVSAIGHETDFTITDFVADCRAATPSAAAELVFPIKTDLLLQLQHQQLLLKQRFKQHLQQRRSRLALLRAKLGDGRSPIQIMQQKISYLLARLDKQTHWQVQRFAKQLTQRQQLLQTLHPKSKLATFKNSISHFKKQLIFNVQQSLSIKRQRLQHQAAILQNLSPLGILSRGYSIVLDEQAQALRCSTQTAIGQTLHVRLHKGSLLTTVQSIHKP